MKVRSFVASAVLSSLEQKSQHFPWALLYIWQCQAEVVKSQTQNMDLVVYRIAPLRCLITQEGYSKRKRSSLCSYLSPNANSVSDVIFTVRELSDAIVYSNTALSRSQIFFCHFYPAQRSHSKALKKKTKNICHITATMQLRLKVSI